jgi:prepilin-type N-terminal cleavage/methylation domain-containing protein
MSHLPTLRRRGGFTLIEMMIAVSVLLLVFAAAVPFFRVQARSVAAHAGRNDAQQNARFAMSAIDRDLRVAGAGIVVQQPMIVLADEFAVTFNADLVSADTADPGAVYFDPSADPLGTTVLPNTRQITLPNTSQSYPSMTYMQGTAGGGSALPSRAETISYWMALDSGTARSDDYVMWRQVNDLTPTIVAKGLIVPSGDQPFRYFTTDSLGASREIPASQLPLVHRAPVHGANDDTASSALTDSIRNVRVRLTSIFSDARGDSAVRSVEGSIRLLNSGLTKFSACGEPPLGPSLAAAPGITAGGQPFVRLTWVPSIDESAGERDVERYALFKRSTTSTDWGEPFASVPAGLATYSFDDLGVVAGETWVYGLMSQDCTPASSSVSSVGPITLIP